MLQPSLQSACIHEAGHAVYSLLNGVDVTCLTVNPKSLTGYCNHDAIDDPLVEIEITLAGSVAEKIFLNWRGNNLPGGKKDIKQVYGILKMLYPDQSEISHLPFLQRTERKIKRVLKREEIWDQVIELAGELARKKRFTGEEIKKTVLEHGLNPQSMKGEKMNNSKVTQAFNKSHSKSVNTKSLSQFRKENKRDEQKKKDLESIPLTKEFGLWLAIERTKRQLSQDEMAEKSGLSQAMISLLELNKRRRCQFGTIRKINNTLCRVKPKEFQLSERMKSILDSTVKK